MKARGTILIVDDNPTLLRLAREIFELAEYTVITATDGEVALAALAHEKIDLVVTDILMPNVDGYLLCYKIRTSENLRNIPIIVYTATYTSASDEAMAMEIGADRFIRKPAGSNLLIAEAAKLISEKDKHKHKIPSRPISMEATRQYNGGLVTKLENKNIQLEQTTSRLQLSEARLKEAQSIAHIGSWEIDLVSGIHTWSDEFYQLLWENKEVQPSEELFLSFIHPDDVQFVATKLSSALKTLQDSSFSYRFVRKDQSLRYGYSEYKFEFDSEGNPMRLFGIIQDITDKRLAEQALQAAHERLLFHIENTPLGFIEWDRHLHVRYWSDQATQIFGWTESELIEAQISGHDHVYEEDAHWVSKVADDLISGQIIRNKIQHRNYTKSGKVIWCEWFNSVLKDKDGNVVTIMSLVQDITEQKTNEEVTRQNLEKLVEERTLELNEALKKEKELAELKSRFVSIASHEFRTPLSSISFAAESIRNYFHQLTAHDIKRKLIKIEELTSHMTHLLEDVLTVGRAEAGKIKVMFVSVDLKEFIESLVDEVKAPLKEERIVTLDFQCEQNKVSVDDKLLRNVVLNLLTNALKFSAVDKPVIITVKDANDEIQIEVKDYGIGIDKMEIDSIFEAFHRGSNASTIQGTGLGLSILKKSLEIMGGSAAVDSALNQGSRFTVSIPVR